MSADRLREAARVLRERAAAADAMSSAPWESVPAGAWTGRVFGGGSDGPGTEMAAKTSTSDPDNHSIAVYIATIHPGVGLALADWLEWTSVLAENDGTLGSVTLEKSLELADLILGSAS